MPLDSFFFPNESGYDLPVSSWEFRLPFRTLLFPPSASFGGQPPSMPGLRKTLQPRFHFLNVEYYNITALGCFMVLFLKRPAGLNLLCPTGSLNFAVFCFLFDLHPPPPTPTPGFGEGGGVGWLLCFLFSVCMNWLKSVITGS